MKVNFRKLRKSLNMTQVELAERMGCGQTNISYFEKMLRPTPDETYNKLVELFGNDIVDSCVEPDIPTDGRETSTDKSNEQQLINMLAEQQKQIADLISVQKRLIDMIASKFPDIK